MKTRFTLFILFGILLAVNLQAQDWKNYNDDRGYYNRHAYREDFRGEHFEMRDLKIQLYNLQMKLNHELRELDNAYDCGDRDRIYHEQQEVAGIRNQIWQINQRMRWQDHEEDEHYRHHEYRDRF